MLSGPVVMSSISSISAYTNPYLVSYQNDFTRIRSRPLDNSIVIGANAASPSNAASAGAATHTPAALGSLTEGVFAMPAENRTGGRLLDAVA